MLVEMSDVDSDETIPYPADEEQMGTVEEETRPDNRDTAPARKRKRRRKWGKKQAGPSEMKNLHEVGPLEVGNQVLQAVAELS